MVLHTPSKINIQTATIFHVRTTAQYYVVPVAIIYPTNKMGSYSLSVVVEAAASAGQHLVPKDICSLSSLRFAGQNALQPEGRTLDT